MPDDKSSVDTPPATPPATSPEAPATPPQPSNQENVVLSKEAHAELTRKAAVAETAQKNEAGLQRKLDAMLRRKVEPLPPLEAQAVATVKSKVSAAIIAANAKYAPLLQKNPMLAKVLAKNPLDLLETDEFLDEQDAANQILDFLDTELSNSIPVAAIPPVTPSAPAPKAPNPDESVLPTDNDPESAARKEAVEKNSKLPPIKRVANSIAERLKINEP